ncbi:hypothetical protein CEXT_448751 [Caerostris extrusa]|uniref:Uncharacterized protein n=1 Tax=Caerostris extrusa TaxID=172846 RepID=A0AAV4W5M8_CAEEX|nr:hypothetical protein CEXT_448751 [Caerostris extrusa]
MSQTVIWHIDSAGMTCIMLQNFIWLVHRTLRLFLRSSIIKKTLSLSLKPLTNGRSTGIDMSRHTRWCRRMSLGSVCRTLRLFFESDITKRIRSPPLKPLNNGR